MAAEKFKIIIYEAKEKEPEEAVLPGMEAALEPTILTTIDYDAPINPVKSGYCKYNPQIQSFAQADPDSMAATIIFVYASMEAHWGRLKSLFPEMMEHLKKFGTLNVGGKYPMQAGVPWSQLVGATNSQRAMEIVWRHRVKIYNDVMPLIKKYKDDPNNYDPLFDVMWYIMTLPHLRTIKAGFVVQLFIGRLGCIDSVNQNIIHVPLSAVVVPGASVPSAARHFKADQYRREFAKIPPGVRIKEKIPYIGRSSLDYTIDKYIENLKILQQAGDLNESQRLWDLWTQIVTAKILFRGQKGKVEIIKGGQQFLIDPYKAPRGTTEISKRELDWYLKHEFDPEGLELSRQHLPFSEQVSVKIKKGETWYPPDGFYDGQGQEIAKVLREVSDDFSQAARRLNFYRNRYEDKLSNDDKGRLNSAFSHLVSLYKDAGKKDEEGETASDLVNEILEGSSATAIADRLLKGIGQNGWLKL